MGKANWSNLGSALSGMGAGFSGRGELWRRNQMLAEEQEMREAQRQEMLKRNDALKFSFQALNAHQPGGSPEVIGLIESRLRNLNSAGIDASDTMDLLERYTTNPDAAAAQWQSGLAWAQMSGQLNVPSQTNQTPAAIQELQHYEDVLANPQNYDPEYVKLIKTKGGLVARAGLSANERIAGDPALSAAVTGYLSNLEGSKSTSREDAAGVQQRRTQRITWGHDAAKGLATARRGLELLKKVKTGGIDAVDIKTRQKLGAETADQGELSNLLGKAVLSQLKETFGAQFTEKEGRLLMDIEAGIGKNEETNIRLLNRIVKQSEMYAKRALNDALSGENPDYATAASIQELMDFDISPGDGWLGGGGDDTESAYDAWKREQGL